MANTFCGLKNAFLQEGADIPPPPQISFTALRVRVAPNAAPLPDSAPDRMAGAGWQEIRAALCRLARAILSCASIARGLPEKEMKMAKQWMININRASGTHSGKQAA